LSIGNKLIHDEVNLYSISSFTSNFGTDRSNLQHPQEQTTMVPKRSSFEDHNSKGGDLDWPLDFQLTMSRSNLLNKQPQSPASICSKASSKHLLQRESNSSSPTSACDATHFFVITEKQDDTSDLHPLLRAACWEWLYEALQNLQSSSDPILVKKALTSRNETGETVLHTAAYKAPLRLALQLFELVPQGEHDYFLSLQDKYGNTPLHYACASLNEEMDFSVIKRCTLMAPRTLEVKNNCGDTPLHMLVTSPAFRKSGHFSNEVSAEEAITSLVLMVPHLGTDQNRSGLTLLHAAIANQAHELVLLKLLSLYPEQARLEDKRGMLPLHYVAALGGISWTLVDQLIWAYPESITHQTLNGDTPLHLLVSNSSKHIKNDHDLEQNTLKLVKQLIGLDTHELRSPLFIRNCESLSPIHCCVIFNAPVCLTKVLMKSPLARKASTLKTRSGATALHLVCASRKMVKSARHVEALATKRACTVRDRHGLTPLMVAVQNKRLTRQVVQILIRTLPQSVFATTSKNYLPLHLAVHYTKAKRSVIKLLVKANPASLMMVSNKGNTPLHEACKHRCSMPLLKLLLEHYPSSIKVKNEMGQIPLEMALRHGADKEMLDFLANYAGGTWIV
jgi:ankyrin repeat protein